MLYIISKLLNFFTNPINWIFLLLGFAALVQKRKARRILLWLSLIFTLLFTNKQLATYGLHQWSKEYNNTLPVNKQYQTAIVLGGAVRYSSKWNLPDYNESADRITESIRMYRLGRIKKIIILGESAFKPEYAAHTLIYMEQMGVNPADIILEQESRTTRENILFVKSILEDQGVKDNNTLLITSGWHMRRALKGFENNSIHPIPYAVDVPSPEPIEKWTDVLPSWQDALKWQKIFHEIAGLLVI